MPTVALVPPVVLASVIAGLIASRAVVAVPAGERLAAVPWRDHLATAGGRRALPIAGAVTAGAGLAAVALPAVYWPTAIWLVFLAVTLSAIDLRHRRLPDRLTLPGLPILMLTLLIPALSNGTWGPWGRAWLGAAVLGAAYWVGWFIGGMGYGDVKLAPTIGAITAWCGWIELITAALAATVIGAAAGVVLAIPKVVAAGRGDRWVTFRKAQLPFGPAMFAGALIAMVWGEQAVTWYLTAML